MIKSISVSLALICSTLTSLSQDISIYVQGTVRDGKTGKPLPNADVLLYSASNSIEVDVMENGSYSLGNNEVVPGKDYVLLVVAESYLKAEKEISTKEKKKSVALIFDFDLRKVRLP